MGTVALYGRFSSRMLAQRELGHAWVFQDSRSMYSLQYVPEGLLPPRYPHIECLFDASWSSVDWGMMALAFQSLEA